MNYLFKLISSFVNRYFAITLLAIGLCCWGGAAQSVSRSIDNKSTVLRYDVSGSNDWYPYFIPNSQKPGIVTEVVVAVLAEAHIEGQQVAMPPKRTLVALANGELDFDVSSPSWFPGNKVPDGYVLSDGLMEIKEYIVTLPKNANRFSDISSLDNQNIGTVRGYFYKNDRAFTRVDFISESKLIEALLKERIDAVIMGDLPALFWAQQNKTQIAFGAINSHGDLHLRLREEHAYLLPQINHAIAKLKHQGRITDIVSRYLSHVPNTATVASHSSVKDAE